MATIAFNCTPAALDKEMAAAYCSVGITMFEQMVQDGTAPKARRFPGRRRVAWLRTELDAWLAGLPLSDLLPPENTGAKKPCKTKAEVIAHTGHAGCE
ncbi:helix-turn-helix transcriptional regulator [Comamonas sp.]|uniref:helix-turn-helix transcriptional regulator n=1 Tax=Comamonas sp. TaxID=34028 RepID=UPI003A907361